MQPDRGVTDGEGHLRTVTPRDGRGHDGRILHGPGAKSPQGVPDGAALDLELSFRRQVLELTSTTEVAGIVRARGLDPARRWRLDRCQTRPSIPRLRLRHL